MRRILTLLLILICFCGNTQTDNQDFENLIRLGEIYSQNVNATGKPFKRKINALRTPNLEHIIDALIAVGEEDKKLLTEEFLTKPDMQELRYWYVLREIHYNNQKEEPRPNDQVAREILSSEIDERWLVDNYYYRIRSGI